MPSVEFVLWGYGLGALASAALVGWVSEFDPKIDRPASIAFCLIWPLAAVAALTATIASYLPKGKR